MAGRIMAGLMMYGSKHPFFMKKEIINMLGRDYVAKSRIQYFVPQHFAKNSLILLFAAIKCFI
jgi:hypothetical protein